jgi:Ferritin-like
MADSASADVPNINLIVPQNLTATAQYNVIGNPPGTRPESGVGNCYPGLEYDHRNLDRRFFPGLLVDYVADGDQQGIRVAAIVTDDPGLRTPPSSHPELGEQLSSQLSQLPRPTTGTWFIHTVTFIDTDSQVSKQIALVDDNDDPLDGKTCWRLIRSLRHGLVTLKLQTRPAVGEPVELAGWRRLYTDQQTGVIDTAYRPGELTQSLCSPWTHDFRDCACTYWASNHPDIVAPAIPLGEPTQPGGLPVDDKYNTQLNWLRDPELPISAEPLPTQPANRPFEISYYQINQQWQALPVVLEGREHDGVYFPRSQKRDFAEPFATPEELRDCVTKLAGLEHLVALLYLYAYFSIISPDQAADFAAHGKWRTLVDDVTYMRLTLMDIAIGEMQHLRAVNVLLWNLDKIRGHKSTPAVVPPATEVPRLDGRATLAPLTLETVQNFITIERFSGYIDGQYSQVAATLRDANYPPRLFELASTIADEGEEHFLEFTRIHALIRGKYYTEPVYLRPIKEAAANDRRSAQRSTTTKTWSATS